VCYDGSLFVFQFCRAIWLWVLLTGSGDDLCDCYLPCFREWLITHLLLVFLPFQHFFTDSSAEISSLPLPLSPLHFQWSHPFCCVLDYSSLFIVQFFWWRVCLPRGLCWFIPGVAGGIPSDAWCSPVWSAECLADRFGVSGSCSSCSSPPVFSI
jgi:hypothetical protein